MAHPVNQSDPKKQFGETLRAVRLGVGVSQEELAHRAELDRTYVSSCERGKRNVSLETIVKLADALGVPPSALLSGLDRSRGDR
ncbi:helix-turn-helix transcriptional regulator [Burkholderia thailandensis]|uniref:helix-turn-helix domain-containing protein n=1 Tax=Burkholderia TaxID=32008 RepID=UPI000CFEDB76|nr:MULTISPECIES: helix-turn-helix transcriptional regulator [Burkholderia]MBS2128284.1 helix-turn-helix transcriptional regulator [Burkholderia thailandensis]PRE16538.1 XRE family transcriptional regulator [Burkholderia gladioli]QRA11343.1 helix-turn-helix transcriptional regulator [Burkholderia thailandensis]